MPRTIRHKADGEGVATGAALLRAGKLVAFPTETVYGLGADARSSMAVAGLYAAKGRPQFNPLIAHVASPDQARGLGMFNDAAKALAAAFWPGPLTLVLPSAPESSVCSLARAGLPSVALRVPAHPVARALLIEADCPVAAPSANRSGRLSPTTADHVAADLDGAVDLILDGGATSIGVESTIVACLGDRVTVLRPGGVPRDAIAAVVGDIAGCSDETAVMAPGMLASHYAPQVPIRLNAFDASADEAILDFGARLADAKGAVYLDLSPAGDLAEAASNLFDWLHRLDTSGATRIAAAPVPHYGLGEAINDRLKRAAAPRG